jgi:hypothetical protein
MGPSKPWNSMFFNRYTLQVLNPLFPVLTIVPLSHASAKRFPNTGHIMSLPGYLLYPCIKSLIKSRLQRPTVTEPRPSSQTGWGKCINVKNLILVHILLHALGIISLNWICKESTLVWNKHTIHTAGRWTQQTLATDSFHLIAGSHPDFLQKNYKNEILTMQSSIFCLFEDAS